jgi:glycosyltransferase involved in cell wall biosynthesis
MEAKEAPQTHNGVPQRPKVIVDVSVVMPCLNEEDAIAACIDGALSSVAAMGLSGEVVVVDNGSTDNSVAVARATGARVVHEPARGYGNACRRGLSDARGRYLVMGDSDGTYDFAALPDFVRPLIGGVDMVIGNRLNEKMEDGAMPWLHRYVGNPVLTGTMNVLYRSDIGDAHCGLRSVAKPFYDQLELSSPGMEFASEFLIEALQHGVAIDQVPIVYRRRLGGQPKLRTFRDGVRHLRLMLALWWSTRHERERKPVRREWHPSAAIAAGGGDAIVDLSLLVGHETSAREVLRVSADGVANGDRIDLV